MPWGAQFRIHTRQRGPCLISPHLWDSRTFASDTFFEIEPQKRSRLTKLGAQTQHKVIQQFVPPSASKQSEITCARDKCVVFHNIGQAISGSTEYIYIFLGTCTFVHGSLLGYNTRIYMCNYSGMCMYVELCLYVWPSQPGKIANPARGQQLIRENELFAVLVRS